LYAENHRKLVRLFAPGGLAVGSYASSIGDGLDLRVDVIVDHRYTSEFRLTYMLIYAASGAPDPSAFVRLYRDAHQAEATHCHAGKRWQDAIGLFPPTDTVIRHRLRMNTFLGKWLDYLAEQGHGVARLRPLVDAPVLSDGPARTAAGA
jgi:uncharacterized protein YqiB (DUF1249 family)